MAKDKGAHWGRRIGIAAGVLVILRSLVFVIARAFGLARNEVQARGGDVNFVLGLAERRRHVSS
jgi:hypothetical protein